MWSKKWYLKGDISCDAHLLNELLETDVENYINYLRMSALRSCHRGVGRLTEETVGCLSELRSSPCERRKERTVLRPALLPIKTAQFTQFFRQV
jgi:hypothetical protein